MQQNRGFRSASIPALLCLSLVGGTLTPFEAAAQNLGQGCECVVSQGETAVVRFAEGRVRATQPGGLLSASTGTQVLVPGKVVAGPQSSAVVVLGRDCEVRVDPRQTVEIERDGGQLCVAVLKQASGTTFAEGGLLPEAIAATLIGTGLAVGFAINDPDKGVSR